jgi:hypothetical protein
MSTLTNWLASTSFSVIRVPSSVEFCIAEWISAAEAETSVYRLSAEEVLMFCRLLTMPSRSSSVSVEVKM